MARLHFPLAGIWNHLGNAPLGVSEWGCFHRDLAEEERPILNVGRTIPRPGVPGPMKRRKWAALMHMWQDQLPQICATTGGESCLSSWFPHLDELCFDTEPKWPLPRVASCHVLDQRDETVMTVASLDGRSRGEEGRADPCYTTKQKGIGGHTTSAYISYSGLTSRLTLLWFCLLLGFILFCFWFGLFF